MKRLQRSRELTTCTSTSACASEPQTCAVVSARATSTRTVHVQRASA